MTRRHLALALVAGIWSPRAFATTVNVDICFRYTPSFVDVSPLAVGDDYLTSNGPRAAAGIWYGVTQWGGGGGWLYDGYTPWTGSSPGCSGPLALTLGATYIIAAPSDALVNGNYLQVRDDDATPAPYWISATVTPTASGTVYIDSPVDSAWNIAVVAAHAMGRRNAGLSGKTLEFFTQQCPTATNGSCNHNGKVYIQPIGGAGPDASQKFLIAHEMGHLVARLANGGLGAATDDSAPVEGCDGRLIPGTTDPQNSGHYMVTKEFQSEAANEGIANYYAAVAFNNTTQDDCRWEYYKDADWDLAGHLSWQSHTFSCEGGGYWYTPPGGVRTNHEGDWVSHDHLGEWCEPNHPGTFENRGTELDWLRFFWDVDHDQGVTTTEIFDIWDAANPHSWRADGAGSSFTCGVTDWPAGRLRCGAMWRGLSTEWDREMDVNGVGR